MVTDERIIALFKPVAAEILAADADAVAQLSKSRELFSGLDAQPAAVAMASQRRALVATRMHRLVAPAAGWKQVDDNFSCGAYEWIGPEGEFIRLSKTTPETRKLEAAKALQGVQVQLIESPPSPSSDSRETILIRLMGNPLTDASVDVVCVGRKGVRTSAIPLAAIAAFSTQAFPGAAQPAKAKVTLPGGRQHAESAE
jgi:hypothetical protein